ncbi:MAG TPA: hypothetical protein VID29_11135 [Solirubrobacteraceae bacterium]|jgi:DNA-binding HxlR family transcriptional regulator
MQDERNEIRLSDPGIAQRAIVLQALRDDHDEWWSRAELERVLYDVEPLALSDALAALQSEGVVQVNGELVRATRCARHLDVLGMVSI